MKEFRGGEADRGDSSSFESSFSLPAEEMPPAEEIKLELSSPLSLESLPQKCKFLAAKHTVVDSQTATFAALTDRLYVPSLMALNNYLKDSLAFDLNGESSPLAKIHEGFRIDALSSVVMIMRGVAETLPESLELKGFTTINGLRDFISENIVGYIEKNSDCWLCWFADVVDPNHGDMRQQLVEKTLENFLEFLPHAFTHYLSNLTADDMETIGERLQAPTSRWPDALRSIDMDEQLGIFDRLRRTLSVESWYDVLAGEPIGVTLFDEIDRKVRNMTFKPFDCTPEETAELPKVDYTRRGGDIPKPSKKQR